MRELVGKLSVWVCGVSVSDTRIPPICMKPELQCQTLNNTLMLKVNIFISSSFKANSPLGTTVTTVSVTDNNRHFVYKLV